MLLMSPDLSVLKSSFHLQMCKKYALIVLLSTVLLDINGVPNAYALCVCNFVRCHENVLGDMCMRCGSDLLQVSSDFRLKF